MIEWFNFTGEKCISELIKREVLMYLRHTRIQRALGITSVVNNSVNTDLTQCYSGSNNIHDMFSFIFTAIPLEIT